MNSDSGRHRLSERSRRATLEHTRLTQAILIESATWWMGDDERTEFLIQVILAMAAQATVEDSQ